MLASRKNKQMSKKKKKSSQAAAELTDDYDVIILEIGDRTYELIKFVKDSDQQYITRDTLFKRAKELKAELGEEDCNYFIDHQDDIPNNFEGTYHREWENSNYFVFLGWRHFPHLPNSVATVKWDGDEWDLSWSDYGGTHYCTPGFLVRRIS